MVVLAGAREEGRDESSEPGYDCGIPEAGTNVGGSVPLTLRCSTACLPWFYCWNEEKSAVIFLIV